MDRRVGLELDVGLDPRRRRIDDRDAGEHVRLVDAVAEHGGGRGELGARVDALGLGGIGGDVRGDALAVLDEEAHGVGQVQLALRVAAARAGRAPARAARRGRRRSRVDLVDRELVRRRVARPRRSARRAPSSSRTMRPYARGSAGAEREHVAAALLAAMRLERARAGARA